MRRNFLSQDIREKLWKVFTGPGNFANLEGLEMMFWFCSWNKPVLHSLYLVSSSLGELVKCKFADSQARTLQFWVLGGGEEARESAFKGRTHYGFKLQDIGGGGSMCFFSFSCLSSTPAQMPKYLNILKITRGVHFHFLLLVNRKKKNISSLFSFSLSRGNHPCFLEMVGTIFPNALQWRNASIYAFIYLVTAASTRAQRMPQLRRRETSNPANV